MRKKRLRYQFRINGTRESVRPTWAQAQLKCQRLVWKDGYLKPAPGYRLVFGDDGVVYLRAPQGEYWNLPFTQNYISKIYNLGNVPSNPSDFVDFGLVLPRLGAERS